MYKKRLKMESKPMHIIVHNQITKNSRIKIIRLQHIIIYKSINNNK